MKITEVSEKFDMVFCQDFGQVKSKHNSFPFT